MDRAISTTTLHRYQLRRWLVAVEPLSILLAAGIGLRQVVQLTLRRVGILTVTGEVNAALTVPGTVIPAWEANLKSPIQSATRQVALVGGTRVAPGQFTLELDKDLAAPTLTKLNEEQLRNRDKNAQLRLALAHALTDLPAQARTQALKVSSLQSALRDERYLLAISSGTVKAMCQADFPLRTAWLEA
jgi:HlyD family secretion protein